MQYYCAYTWHHDTTMEQVARMIVEDADAGKPGPEMIRGYYGLVGGGAGFLILETDDPLQVKWRSASGREWSRILLPPHSRGLRYCQAPAQPATAIPISASCI